MSADVINYLQQLWQKRYRNERAEALPNWKYALSSGFGLFSAAVIITIIQGYASLLRITQQTGEAAWPLPLAGAVLLTPLLLWNPVRTYLAEADAVFLTPAEPAMGHYFRLPKRRGLLMSSAAVAAVLAALWPFFAAIGGTLSEYVFIIAAVFIIKAVLFYGAWAERRLESRLLRIVFFVVKTAALFASIHHLFRVPHGFAVAAGIAVIWTSYSVSLRAPASFHLHWEHLIREERSKQAMVERWFSQFVDLPRREETYRRRGYLESFLRFFCRRKNESPFLYLYWRTLLRSSMFWILARLILLACFLMALFPGFWAVSSIYAGFVFLTGIQLKSLQSIRRDVLHLAVSPIPESERSAAVRTVRRSAHRICNALAALPLFALVPWYLALAALGFGLLAPFLFGSGRRRR